MDKGEHHSSKLRAPRPVTVTSRMRETRTSPSRSRREIPQRTKRQACRSSSVDTCSPPKGTRPAHEAPKMPVMPRHQLHVRALVSCAWPEPAMGRTGVTGRDKTSGRRRRRRMKAIRYHQVGGPEALRLWEMREPVVAPGEVRIRVRAAGESFADTERRRGRHGANAPHPRILASEVAGNGGVRLRRVDTSGSGAGGGGKEELRGSW